MRTLLKSVMLIVAAGTWIVAAGAQQSTNKPELLFQQLFPQPTGQNGYEELTAAGDFLKKSVLWQEIERAGSPLTLAEKRRVLMDAMAKRALESLRAGLGKSIATPHVNIDDETRLPEMASFRSLARLISLEMYVDFADGRVGDAVTHLTDALRFGYSVQSGMVIGGLVGVAIDAIGMRQMTDHMDQLSARDCDRLTALASDWLDLPDPQIGLMDGELGSDLRMLSKYRSQPGKLRDALGPQKDDSPNGRRLVALLQSLADNPSAAGPMLDDAGAKITAFHDKVVASLKLPIWERKEIDPALDDSPASVIAGAIIPSVNQASDRFGREQAQVQLLGVHAAIRRYRWEHDALPSSLELLKLGRLGIDPFIGRPFTYRRIGDKTYEISSAGPLNREEGAAPGSRTPIK